MFVLLGGFGISGAVLMFISDLILYLPQDPATWTSRMYYSRIDPTAGAGLLRSPMRDIPDWRLMLGGVLGPISALLYSIGFLQVIPGLHDSVSSYVLPAAAAAGFSGGIIVGAVYHALFTWTGFLSKTAIGTSGGEAALVQDLLNRHQAYLSIVYRVAGVFWLIGAAVFTWCIVSRTTSYPRYLLIVLPPWSAILKRGIKKLDLGSPGLLLVGGCTNLWNIVFFTVATMSTMGK